MVNQEIFKYIKNGDSIIVELSICGTICIYEFLHYDEKQINFKIREMISLGKCEYSHEQMTKEQRIKMCEKQCSVGNKNSQFMLNYKNIKNVSLILKRKLLIEKI